MKANMAVGSIISHGGRKMMQRSTGRVIRQSAIQGISGIAGFSQGTLGLVSQEMHETDAILPAATRARGAGDIRLMLALHAMGFLSWREKLRLLAVLDSAEDLGRMDLADLMLLARRSIRRAAWNPRARLEEAERQAILLQRTGARFVSVLDPEYPALLREIHRAPFGIFVRGTLPRGRSITVVGTRGPTWAGIKAARAVAQACVLEGCTVVSGLARGIDAAAHRGALAAAGTTVAVLPSPIDSVYPASNRALAADMIRQGGALISEYPPGASMERFRFPERNRILAGLSPLTVIVEAPERSGALITADFALSEGRDVAVARACLYSSRNAGGLALALQGACQVEGKDDLKTILEGGGIWNMGTPDFPKNTTDAALSNETGEE
ncbi:MAG: DNA-processing protein DprA [Spirochaetaceae bacterium]|nr:DNA-processing protein DprA [Spirochaetaceae bacterium]